MTMPVKLDDNNDEWFESEESTRVGLIQEVQRIRRRTRVRPIPVILLALLITGGLTYKVATKRQMYYSEVVLALREGSLLDANKTTGLPMEELKEFVQSVLLPDARLSELIEKHDLNRLRKTLGMPWAITELRESIELEVWRNSFIYYDPDNSNREASARIGLTVGDDDPDRAYMIAHDLAEVVIEEVREQRLKLAKKAAQDIAAYRDALTERMEKLERERTERMIAQSKAKSEGKIGVSQVLGMRLLEIDQQQKETEKSLSAIAASPEALADRIAEAGLDLVIEIVSERRPARPESKGMLIVMIGVVVGLGSLLGASLVLGAFDSRVHDTDDIARLGLPVLGHVPGFPGDRLGALEARGVQGGRVPLYSRWRAR
jgi:capsular polysaccharide biosynthesis protein